MSRARNRLWPRLRRHRQCSAVQWVERMREEADNMAYARQLLMATELAAKLPLKGSASAQPWAMLLVEHQPPW